MAVRKYLISSLLAGIFLLSIFAYSVKARHMSQTASLLESVSASGNVAAQEKSAPVPEPLFVPASLSWEKVQAQTPWEARDSHAVIVYKDKIWLMGGLDANGHVDSPGMVEYDKAKYFSDVWSSENGINWKLVIDNALWGKRRSLQVVEFNGKMWLVGGWVPGKGCVNDIWSSDDGINWKLEISSAAFPAREGHQVIVFQNKMWMIGGVSYEKHKLFNDVWSSDDGINWIEVTSSAAFAPRWDDAVTVFNNKLWLSDGMIFDGRFYKDVWYSDDGVNWIEAPQAPFSGRQGNFITEYKGKLWVIGRLDAEMNGGVNDVWYSGDGLTWQKTQTNPGWTGREDFGAIIFKDKIWILGGMDRNWTWTNDVWYSTFN